MRQVLLHTLQGRLALPRFPRPLLRGSLPCRRQVLRAAEKESAWWAVQELLGATGGDPGSWNFSPEWFGTQDGGWGRDAGQTVFAADSAHGNGRVTVTAHQASVQEGQAGSVQEWRVLRFNGVTRQSVARVTLLPPPRGGPSSGGDSSVAAAQPGELAVSFLPSTATEGSGNESSSSPGGEAGWGMTQQADCLAPEYLKSMASLVAGLIGLQGLLARAGTRASSQGIADGAAGGQWGTQATTAVRRRAEEGQLRVLCIGLGGGSLPLFLAHHFPLVLVDAVELDPAVVAAATLAMGLPASLPNLRIHTGDALQFVADFVARQQQQQQQEPEPQQRQEREQEQEHEEPGGREGWRQPFYDLVIMDAFDGQDNVPEALCSPGFAQLLATALHPRHGTLLINMHSKDPRRAMLLPGMMLGLRGPPADLGYDAQGPDGSRIVAAAATFAAALGGANGAAAGGGSAGSDPGVRAFTVSVARQLNVEVVVARGLALDGERGLAAQELKAMAAYVSAQAGYRFPAGKRACRGYCQL